jgi:hypothetical protein
MKKALFVICILASVSLLLPSTEAAPILFDADLSGFLPPVPELSKMLLLGCGLGGLVGYRRRKRMR